MQDGGEIFKGEARRDGVYAYAELGDVVGAGLGQEGEDVGPCGGFLGGRHGVFEVVGYRVDGESTGFFKEFGR